MATGRSSYVEMRALDRLTKHNIKTRVSALRKSLELNGELDDFLSKIPQAMSDGYTKVLTPNGIVRESQLDHLLSIDSDIVIYIGMFESEKSQIIEIANTLKELVEERKKLVDSFKA